jgi:hypothetical protein
MHSTTLLSLLAAGLTTVAAAPKCKPSTPPVPAPAAGEVKCPVVFDGRVPSSAELADFDSYATSLFNPDYVKGQNLKWSEIIKFPAGLPAARFDDADEHKPFEVTISDQSIFMTQYGFRRAGLLFQGDTNNGSPGTQGVKTIHFSLHWDSQRPLNLSHEYLLTWHETVRLGFALFVFSSHFLIFLYCSVFSPRLSLSLSLSLPFCLCDFSLFSRIFPFFFLPRKSSSVCWLSERYHD